MESSTNNEPITDFRGAYNFLSNFYTYPFIYKGVQYLTLEHAFQAAKTNHPQEKHNIATANSPGMAKKLGRMCNLREDWQEVKDDIMLDLLRIKFSPQALAFLLLRTGDRELVEGNTWGDRYWGQCPLGFGENRLGKLLMQVRVELKAQGT